MHLSGETEVAAPPEAVWEALTDARLLCRLIPGCEAMTGDVAAGYDVVASRAVAGMSARLTGRIEIVEHVPGQGCSLRAWGQGGGAGAARGTGRVTLAPTLAGTRLGYEVEAAVEGPLARVPGFVVRMVAGRMIHAFLDRFAVEVEREGAR